MIISDDQWGDVPRGLSISRGVVGGKVTREKKSTRVRREGKEKDARLQ